MEKKVLVGCLVSSMLSVAAVADVYVGVEYGSAKNTTTLDVSGYGTIEGDNDYSDVKFKIGTGTDGGVKFQGTLSLISYDETVFDDTNKDLMEFGVDFMKEFEVSPSFYPFIKAGFGVGSMTVDGYSEDSIVTVSFNLGAGISYKATENIYVIGGVDYVARKWQDIEYSGYNGYYYETITLSTSDSAMKPYIGINYKF